MSFDQGLSGLAASGKALDVIGNNVANAGTVGFKGSQAEFADVYAASLNGAGGAQIGIGTRLAAVAQQFTQGNISITNNPLDLAVNGSGFFRMSAPNGAVSYTRNGQFQLDKDGFIVNTSGLQLTGYDVDALGNIMSTGAPNPIQLTAAKQALSANATTKLSIGLNLDSRMSAPTVGPFDPTNPLTYNSSTSATIYDSLGNSHVLATYYVKEAAPAVNTWDVWGTFDGTIVDGDPGTAGNQSLGTLAFSTSGQLSSFTPSSAPPLNITMTNGSANLALNFDFTGSTQAGGAFNVNTLAQDGYTFGTLAGLNVGADGVILGRYTNGQSRNLGQVVLANFANPQGLQAIGNNQWVESAASGLPIVGAPSTGKFGALQAGAVEDSNVDLTVELVNMITAQRNYQANAQTIKTQDSILQTITNLR